MILQLSEFSIILDLGGLIGRLELIKLLEGSYRH